MVADLVVDLFQTRSVTRIKYSTVLLTTLRVKRRIANAQLNNELKQQSNKTNNMIESDY